MEDYGWCEKGEGKDYVRSGVINLGGKLPNNTSGGHLCEAYTHGMNMVIENVRQLRGTVDDYCANAAKAAVNMVIENVPTGLASTPTTTRKAAAGR